MRLRIAPIRARFGFAAALVAVAVVLGGSAAPAGVRARAPVPHVTMFGDSIADAIVGYDQARAILADGADVDFEVAACRRLYRTAVPSAAFARRRSCRS
jgi:hypothetical protein